MPSERLHTVFHIGHALGKRDLVHCIQEALSWEVVNNPPVPAQGEAPMRESPNATASRVARPAPLREVVYDALAEMIVNGTLKPGQHLVESDLAENLGVSRQPIREALQRLQADGWVELRPAYGAFVHTPTAEEVGQLLSVRSVLEAHSAYGAALHATQDNIDRLWELQDAGMAALATNDERALVEANIALHQYIVEASRDKAVSELISQVQRRVRWYYTPMAVTRAKEAWDEHANLIRAIAKGDPELAQRLMRQHTERTTEFYLNEIAGTQETLVS
jgi:DNA-binding GntR family transcriptional regulator